MLGVASEKEYDILMELDASNHEFSGQKDLIFLGQNHTKRVTVVLGLVFLWCATHYANLSKLSCCSTSYSQNAGLVAFTGVISRHVGTVAGVILVLLGLFPKLFV